MERRRSVQLEDRFREDLAHWIGIDRKMALRLLDLVEAITRDPFRGIGKPEPLKSLRPNTWSRRLNVEHRVVYVVEHDEIIFVQARYHYDR